MKLVRPRYLIEKIEVEKRVLRRIERIARKCYKSEGRITPTSAPGFIRKRLSEEHDSVVEHAIITVTFICDRGISHEIVRHRIGSYTQESTRYCNYLKKGIKFIIPFFFEKDEKKFEIWLDVMKHCENAYNQLLELGATPEEARTVLPQSLKTEITVTYNLRQWRRFLKRRTSRKAHPQMREIVIPLLRELQQLYPVFFGDIEPN